MVTLLAQRAQSERIKRASTMFNFRRPCRPVGSPSPSPDLGIVSGRMRRFHGYEAFPTLDSGRTRTSTVSDFGVAGGHGLTLGLPHVEMQTARVN